MVRWIQYSLHVYTNMHSLDQLYIDGSVEK
jgi:hypothetical protein